MERRAAFLEAVVKRNPSDVAFGGRSAVGGWDRLKVFLVARAAGIEDVKSIKHISFNNGGTAIPRMLGGHIDAFKGDISELTGQIGAGKIRILGVLADERLPDKFSELPTARKQAYDVIRANWRGFYMGGEVSDEAYQYWVDGMEELYKSDAWEEAMAKNGLVPFWRGGDEFEQFVDKQVKDLRELSEEIGLLN